MDILGDYEMGMLDTPMLRRGDIQKPPPVFQPQDAVQLGQVGDFLNTGDMLDPTVTANSSVAAPPVVMTLSGSAALLALLVITYKRVFSKRTHAHTDDPLLPTASSS